jgi:prophage regulatory protein
MSHNKLNINSFWSKKLEKNQSMKIIRINSLMNILGVSRSTIHRWKQNKVLPPQVNLGTHIVGWDSRDIERWIESNKNSIHPELMN